MMFAKVCAEPKEVKEAVQSSSTQAAPNSPSSAPPVVGHQASKVTKPDTAPRTSTQSSRAAHSKTQSQREADLIRMVDEQS